jgi:hypothetical protein
MRWHDKKTNSSFEEALEKPIIHYHQHEEVHIDSKAKQSYKLQAKGIDETCIA